MQKDGIRTHSVVSNGRRDECLTYSGSAGNRTTSAAESEGDYVLAPQRSPDVSRLNEVRTVAAEKSGNEASITREQMHRPAGAFSDEAANEVPKRVNPDVARHTHRVQRYWRALAKQLSHDASGAGTAGTTSEMAKHQNDDGKFSERHGGECAESR